MRAWRRIVLGMGLAVFATAAAGAESVAVAAAANLVYVLEPLNGAFNRLHPDVSVRSEIGASGSLVAQIRRGAPYDVFLSADMDYPKKLIAAGGADGDSLRVFAFGKLVLWTTRPGVRLVSIAAAVRDPAVRRIAVANPRTAPYGQAAEAVMAKLGLTGDAHAKIVFGENISQTAEFVSSGNAEVGFVALSLVLSPKSKNRGSWLEVPGNLYQPIAQGAVLTTRGVANSAAHRYIDFLGGPEARKVFTRFGYGLP